MENFTYVQFSISQFCICGSPNSANILSLCKSSLHCVKSVQIRSYLFLYFVNLRIQSEYRKIQTRNNSVFGHFSHNMAVMNTPFHRIKYWKHFIITILHSVIPDLISSALWTSSIYIFESYIFEIAWEYLYVP